MKNIFLYPLLFVLVAGCDRLSQDNSAKIQIQMPQEFSKVSTSATSGVLPIPNGLSGPGVSTPINCYLVGVNGPEAELRRNTCNRKDGSHEFKLGQWAGGIAPGGSVTLDVPSGKNRNFYVIGFHATGNSCKNFKAGFPEHDELSNPYIIGKVENVTLNAGETKDLPVQIAFDSQAWFEDCQGPDFPEDGKGGGGSVATVIQFQKEYFPHRAFVENKCQAIDVSLLNASGNSSSYNEPVSFKVTGPGGAVAIYNSLSECSSNTPISRFTIPANENFKQLYIRTPQGTSVSSVSYTPTDILPASLSASGIVNYPNKNGAQKTFLIENPMQLLSGICYAISVRSVNMLGYADPSGVNANIQSPGMSFFSDSSCITASGPLNFTSSVAELTIYAKLNSAVPKTTITVSDSTDVFMSATKTVYGGSGSSIAKSLKMTGPTQLTGFGSCQVYEVSAVNENGVPVPAPQNINFSLSLPSGLSAHNSGGCYSGGSTATLPFGSLKAFIYIKAVDSSAAGPQTITVTDSASVNPLASGAFNLDVDVPVSWQLTGASGNVKSNTCYSIAITQNNFSGSQNQNLSGFFQFSNSNPDVTPNFYSVNSCAPGSALSLPGSLLGGNQTMIGVEFLINPGAPQVTNLQISDPGTPALIPAVINLNVTDVCEDSPAPGQVCAGGTIYIGSLSPGATLGSGTDKYMTTPGGCADVPNDGNRVGTDIPNYYTNVDFTPSCVGSTDTLVKTWNEDSVNWHDIPGLTNYTSTPGTGYGGSNTDQSYGSENTTNIVAITLSTQGGPHAAARYCDKLVYGGYSDWYLPNRYELNLMYTNKASIPGLNMSSGAYWSSTEYGSSQSWAQSFVNGAQLSNQKDMDGLVRCVRRF